MSPTIFRPVLLILLLGSGFQCKRNNNDLSAEMALQPALTGRLVVFDPCGQSAIQVLGGPIDSSRLMTSWKNPDNDSIYHNIFRVSAVRDACSLSFYGLAKGDTLRFSLDPHPQNFVCNTCADSNPVSAPPVSNAVTNVKKISTMP